MRWKPPPIERASAAASVVLPTPGTSSISRWPRASEPDDRQADDLGLADQRPGDAVFQTADEIERTCHS